MSESRCNKPPIPTLALSVLWALLLVYLVGLQRARARGEGPVGRDSCLLDRRTPQLKDWSVMHAP